MSRSVDVAIAGRTVTVTPLRDLRQLKDFDDAVREEFVKWAAWKRDRGAASPDWYAVCGRLVQLGAPEVATDELLSECTAWDKPALLRLLQAAMDLNFPLEGTSLDSLASEEARAAIETYLEVSQDRGGQP